MRTYVAKGAEAEALKVGKNWFVVDATNQVLGRLATKVARVLIGKDKPSFTPYLDSGDHVVVINADNPFLERAVAEVAGDRRVVRCSASDAAADVYVQPGDGWSGLLGTQ